MIQQVHCAKCNVDHVELGATTVDLEFSRRVYECEHCHSSQDFTDRLWFCSPQCFMDYVAEHPELVDKVVLSYKEREKIRKQAKRGAQLEEISPDDREALARLQESSMGEHTSTDIFKGSTSDE